MAMENIIDNLDFTEVKRKFYCSKESVKRNRENQQAGRKIFAKDVSDKDGDLKYIKNS